MYVMLHPDANKAMKQLMVVTALSLAALNNDSFFPYLPIYCF